MCKLAATLRPHASRLPALAAVLLAARAAAPIGAAEEEKPRSVEEIAAAGKGSVVVIHASGRSGEARGTGTGFVVRADGVIATSFHVIGQGRAFSVRLADGSAAKPVALLGYDRAKDLAVFQVDRKELPALELGDSDALRPGQTVLAVGSPLGLEHSVAQGVVAGMRMRDGRNLIQVAMPIEPGSSGSPLLDLRGRVVGVVAIKSAESLGFAVPVNDLNPLLERPRPLPMERWLAIGALDPKRWRTRLGGEWRERGGRLIASGLGEGFGGRMLCLSETLPPEGRFEVGVEVRLADESGAAGLVFHSDGGDRHYGFYPTAGSLRLTRFEGPDVFTWTILATVPSEHYRPGEWNTIKVRVEGARLRCSVNDRPAIEVEDAGLSGGKVGLVKFRAPRAEFRRFRAGASLPPAGVAEETGRKVEDLLQGPLAGGSPGAEAFEALRALGEGGLQAVRDRALRLERDAARLRALAGALHNLGVEARLVEALGVEEERVDLLEAALLIAKLDDSDLEIEPYREMVEGFAGDLRARLGEAADGAEKLRVLKAFFFDELGFHGSSTDYYHRSNSYLNDVLDDREGIPITLAVAFLELARRIDLPLVGIAAPGHFLVEWRPPGAEGQLLDLFDGGKPISRREAEALSGELLDERHFRPATKREIILRMLHNLLGIAERTDDRERALRYLRAIRAIQS